MATFQITQVELNLIDRLNVFTILPADERTLNDLLSFYQNGCSFYANLNPERSRACPRPAE